MISALLASGGLTFAERIKDIVSISGVRTNQLLGYGLVVGLDGTGDNAAYTQQSFKTMLSRLGIQLPAGVNAASKNVAAVAISAELPPFARPGQQIDITVSSIGDSKSLRGGTLLMSYLKGIDGNTYAIAQGNLVVGGFGAEGKDGSQIKVNVPVVGRIPNGAMIEVAAPNTFGEEPFVTLLLHRPDFTTAKRLADTINQHIGQNTAESLDHATVQVSAPLANNERVKFLAAIENLQLSSGEGRAKIVINSRTGTIVIGKNVRVGAAAVSHGSLTVTITEKVNVSQPAPQISVNSLATTVNANAAGAVVAPVIPATPGATVNLNNPTNPQSLNAAITNGPATVVSADSNVYVSQDKSRMFLFNPEVSLEDIVRAINEVGAAPGDLMAILEALKQVGALEAELEII